MAPLRVPPNPFDRWARSESGLHLPSRLVPRAAKRLHHIEKFGTTKNCCDMVGMCLFDASLSEEYDVTLSGFPGIAYCPYNGVTYSLIDLNHTYRLSFVPLAGCWWNFVAENAVAVSGIEYNVCGMHTDDSYPQYFDASINITVHDVDANHIEAFFAGNIQPCEAGWGDWFTLTKGINALDGLSDSATGNAICPAMTGTISFSIAAV